jgi:hypothetical protein
MSSKINSDKKEAESSFMKQLLDVEDSITLYELARGAGLSDFTKKSGMVFLEQVIDELIEKEKIVDLSTSYEKPTIYNKTFIATRKERLEELLERIEANENEWCDWLNLSNYYYQHRLWDKFFMCMETVEKILGNSFESTIRLTNKKQLAWAYIEKARELLDDDLHNLDIQNITNYNPSNRTKAKKLYYKASKMYTNFFYLKQCNTKLIEHITFKSKWSKQVRPNAASWTTDTYKMINGIPIYDFILRDLFQIFGITYEELIQDIKNKLL